MKYLSIAGVSIIFLLLSCTKSKIPSGILEPEKMQSVFWDYIQADVYANEFIRNDSTKNVEIENARLQQQVFSLHMVTKEEFYKSYNYYLNNQVLLREMIDTMMVRQKKVYKSTGDSIRQRLIDQKILKDE